METQPRRVAFAPGGDWARGARRWDGHTGASELLRGGRCARPSQAVPPLPSREVLERRRWEKPGNRRLLALYLPELIAICSGRRFGGGKGRLKLVTGWAGRGKTDFCPARRGEKAQDAAGGGGGSISQPGYRDGE